jgi:hypothetical protein
LFTNYSNILWESLTMILFTRRVAIGFSAAAFVLAAATASAQTAVNNFFMQAAGNWNVPANWSLGGLPNGQTTDDFAVIGGVSGINGVSTGAATVNTVIAEQPGGIQLGLAAANSGTLTIANGGSLTVADTAFVGDGSIQVGVAGTGTLNVERGGALNAVTLLSGGNNASTITLGQTTGAGLATVNVQNAYLARTLRAIGTTSAFSAVDTLELQATNNFIPQITTGGFAPLKAGVVASLGGTLTPEFAAGVTPTLGNSWNLFDARAVAGAFATINASSAPILPLGQVYAVRTANGGTNGKLVQLAVEQRLVINVNRNSGAVSLANTGAAGVAVDGITIGSTTVGALNQAAWSPLDGNWQVSNSSANRVSQLRSASSTTIAGNSTAPLGTLFTPPAPASFGTYAEDLTFQYTQPDGTTRTGVINYSGTGGINNLTLLVDPATGKTQLRNTSPFTVAIDGYTIASTLGSLSTTGWSSLDDQNAAGGDWNESNVTASRLSELKPAGSTTLTPNTSFNLGNAFNTTLGRRDLAFQFVLAGEQTARTGVVVYGSISLTGDFDGNGAVNGADLTRWRGDFGLNGDSDADGDGDSDGADFLAWQRNVGATGSTTSASAIPEPPAGLLATLLAPLAAGFVRRRAN